MDNEQQAFPLAYNLSQAILPGMSLRDYFAAKAMQGMLSGHYAHYGCDEEDWPLEDVAEKAYKKADAMMKAREVKQQ